jgi:hypothetical protein
MIYLNFIKMSSKDVPAIVKNQPGYSGNGTYIVLPSETGTRLYASIAGSWMDASLEDVPELEPYLFGSYKEMSRKGGKAITEAKKKAARENGKKGGRPKTIHIDPNYQTWPRPDGSTWESDLVVVDR